MLSTPDLTKAQILAFVKWVATQAIAFGVLPQRWEQLTVSIASTVLVAVYVLADAIIRHGRSRALITPTLEPSSPFLPTPEQPLPAGGA